MLTRNLRSTVCLFNPVSISITCLLIVLLISGCSDSSSDGTPSTVTTETMALGDIAKNVRLTAGVQTQHTFTYTFPGDVTTRGDYSINMTKTLENATLSSSPVAKNTGRFETLRLLTLGLVKEAFAAETAEVSVHISYAGDPNVCSSSYTGQDNIAGALGSPLTGSKTSVKLTQEAEDIINAGAFDICVVTTPPIDAYVTVPGVVVDFDACATPTVDIVGTWSGTYECANIGTGSEGGPISLTISQNADGSYHYVDDGGAAYDGNLCGSKFKFKGGMAGSYTESGTLIFDGNNATKTSVWISESLISGGRCSDTLQKI